MVHIEAAGLTDVGKKREGNEDAYFLDDTNRLYVVADGMGGHQAGEVASGIVIEIIKKLIEEGEEKTIAEFDARLSAHANHLVSCIRAANRAVYSRAREREEYRGMGSTLAAVYYTDSTFIAANVGDSPIYLVRDGNIEPLSVAHTVAAELAVSNPERLKTLDEKIQHMLTRAMGVNEEVNADVCETQCFKGDCIIICSDGLSNKVSPQEMALVVSQNAPETACRIFIDLANERGGEDNITVIVLRATMLNSKKSPLLLFFSGLLNAVKMALFKNANL